MQEELDPRQGWRRHWLNCIREFADDRTQRRMWLDPTHDNPHYSFVEYCCCYFDDLDLTDRGYDRALDRKLVSTAEIAAVSEFHTIADGYESPTGDYDHEAILSDPKWAEVVTAAKQARAMLLKLIDDPNERRCLDFP